MQRDPAAGDRGRAGAAVGLDDVAIDGDLLLAERLQVDDRAQAAADQPLDLQRPAALLAGRRLAPHALAGRARQHAVLGGHPALAGIAHPARHLFLQARRAQHMRVAELDEAGPFGVLGDAALEGDGAHFVELPFRWTHGWFSLWGFVAGL